MLLYVKLRVRTDSSYGKELECIIALYINLYFVSM